MIIQVENLTKTFGDIAAVNNISMMIERGELVGIIGPDGAGKTTLMRMLAGALQPTEGPHRGQRQDVQGESSGVKRRNRLLVADEPGLW